MDLDDEGLMCDGQKKGPIAGPRPVGEEEVMDQAVPKASRTETCHRWAGGGCIRADTCRFARAVP